MFSIRNFLSIFSFLLLNSVRAFSTEPPHYELIEVPVISPDYYEQMSATCEQMAAVYDKLASEYHHNWGTITLGGDYLFWQANNDNLQYAIDGVGTDIKGQSYSLTPEWTSGFRLNAGYFFPCDDWHLNFSWTHYASNTSRTTTPAPGLLLYVTRGNPTGGFTTVNISAGAKWDFQLNSIQTDFSYIFWTRYGLSLIPKIGLRWDEISDKFNITYLRTAAPTTQLVNINQHIDGIGPMLGLGSEWNFYRNFSIFSDFQWAYLWFRYKVSHRVDVVQAAVTSDINTGDNQYISKHTLDLIAGIKWEYRINSRAGVIIKLGWENLLWIDYGETFYFLDSVTDGINIRANNDLVISGLTLKASVFF